LVPFRLINGPSRDPDGSLAAVGDPFCQVNGEGERASRTERRRERIERCPAAEADAAGARAGKAPVADGTPGGQDRLGDEVPDPLRHLPNGRLHASSLDLAGRVPRPSEPETFSPEGQGFEGRRSIRLRAREGDVAASLRREQTLPEIHSSEPRGSGANQISQPHLGQRKVTVSSWRLPLTLRPPKRVFSG